MVKKIKIYDSTFTPFVKSASLREENKDVHPTHFEWDRKCGNLDDGIFVTDGFLRVQNAFGKNVVAWLIEPRHLHPENYRAVESKYGLFKAVLTYDKELLDKCPNARFYPFGGSSIAFDKWGLYPKTKGVCMILSDKKTTEGHKLRHKIAEEFGDRIDLYGAGVGKPFESKFEVLKDYRFAIVVESGVAQTYFTEKLIDPISVGTVPIYCGTHDLKGAFQGEAHIHQFDVEGAGSLKYLGKIFEWVEESGNATFYQHHTRRKINFQLAKRYRICEDWIWNEYQDLFT